MSPFRLPARLPLRLAVLACLSTCLPAPSACAHDESPAPLWIWGDGTGAKRETIHFRRVFDVPGDVVSAELVGTCDNAWVAYLDGEEVAGGDTWWEPSAEDLTEVLSGVGAGPHVLAVSASNEGGPAGLVLRLAFVVETDAGTETREVVSDGAWRWSRAPAAGWTDPGFEPAPCIGTLGVPDDPAARWCPVTALGPLGTEPWTRIDAEALATTDEVRPSRVTPAERITVPEGFAVELLHTATRGQGSWVALAHGPGGDLFVSDQGDAGLFRIDVSTQPVRVEPVEVDISGAQGLLWADGGLYVVAHGADERGLYKLTDTDGDGRLDDARLLRALGGGHGEHGWHAVLLGPDGRSLYVVAGNQTAPTALSSSRVPPVWGEDQLLPRLPDAGGFMVEDQAPGGCIYRVSLDGTAWELISSGYRNPYDAAFDERGDLYTFDADMEWDLNTPWYRPTRVCLVSSGSEYGWRNGSGKWPAHHADSLPAVLDVGVGSPVGVTFGVGTSFREPWRSALFLGDWSYGRVYAAHLRPSGAAATGELELFMSGAPLPVTDLVVHPDGGLYFTTGGRGVPSGLYRVRDEGRAGSASPSAAASPSPSSVAATATGPVAATGPGADASRRARLALEAFHGRADPAAVDLAWARLGDADRFLRFAARTALEWQPVETWRERALTEDDPATALGALIALARVSGADPEHRGPLDATAALFADGAFAAFAATRDGDGGLDRQRAALLGALTRLPWAELDETGRLDLLRAHALTFTRLGPPDEAERTTLAARFTPRFPSGSPALDAELCALLVFLGAPEVVERGLTVVQRSPTQEEQIALMASLRLARTGWTPALREDYFAWFPRAHGYGGGASFAGFLREIRDDALEGLSDPEREALRAILQAAPIASTEVALQGELAGRTDARTWTLRALAPGLDARLAQRDFGRGRRLFGAAGCFACHRIAGEGGAVGPDLTGSAGRFSPTDVLEAVLEPSRVVSDQYRRVTLRTHDGEVVTGLIVNLVGETVHVGTDMFRPSVTTVVDLREVESMEPSSVSAMPEGLLALLTRDEIDDLVAYVLSGGRADGPMFR